MPAGRASGPLGKVAITAVIAGAVTGVATKFKRHRGRKAKEADDVDAHLDTDE